MIDIIIFQAAAIRADDYMTRYGVICQWTLEPLGMKFTAQSGANKCERYVDWSDLEENSLKNAESQALKGISS